MKNWLREGLEELLRTAPEDISAYSRSYDDCLWRIVTSPRDDLGEVIAEAWTAWNSLPVPLLVAMARIYGAESADDLHAVSASLGVIAPHCDPIEEVNATEGITQLTSKLNRG